MIGVFMNYKKDFPMLKNTVYLDNAATTQKPKQVIETITDYYSNYCANIHRGVYSWSMQASDEYESSRETIAKFINAKPNEIIFVRNATEGLNLIATT
jgi:cysteine desulfurase/selenocysteine lyase